MADNPFSVQVVNPMQALLIGQQAYDKGAEANKARALEQGKQTAAQQYASGDAKGAIATLLGIGDATTANAISGMDQNAWSRQHTTQQDAESSRRFGLTHGLAVRTANRADEVKPLIKEVTDANGVTSLVRVNPQGPEGVVNTGVTPSAPANPFSAGGKFNGDQGKAAGFTDRMLQSEGILSGVGGAPGVQSAGNDMTQTGLSKVPMVGNFLISGDRQKYNQAKADFINSQLRRESGAAIGAAEFENADRQYFPVPGDKPEVIKQKAANRRAAIEAMGREGGGSYKPKFSFDEGGGIVPYGQSAPKNMNAPDGAFPPPPKMGESRGGYRFKGGNPGDPASWAKVSG
jgi:hypothetical protein